MNRGYRYVDAYERDLEGRLRAGGAKTPAVRSGGFAYYFWLARLAVLALCILAGVVWGVVLLILGQGPKSFGVFLFTYVFYLVIGPALGWNPGVHYVTHPYDGSR